MEAFVLLCELLAAIEVEEAEEDAEERGEGAVVVVGVVAVMEEGVGGENSFA